MTQKAYLNALEEALAGINANDKEELMADFKEHFSIGLDEGKSEEEIINHLGTVNELVESLDLKKLKTNPQETKVDRTFSEEIDKVIIDGLHADVTISVSEDNQAHVDYDISKRLLGKLNTEVTTHQEGKTLTVTVSVLNKIFRNNLDPIDLNIQLPQAIKTLNCKTVSGDITIDELEFETLELQSVSGDIELENLTTDKININGVSSDLNCANIKGNFQLKTVSGDIEIDQHTGSELKIETVSGDIDYEGSASEIRVTTTTGDGCFKANSIAEFNVITVSGDMNLECGIEDKGLTVNMVSHSGELSIGDKDYDTPRHHQSIIIGDGKIKANLKSISGDFSIE